MFYLVDDGTLDTVVECSECLTQLRYTFNSCEGECGHDHCDCDCYEQFANWAFEDAKDTHEC